MFILNATIDILLSPFRHLPPEAGLTAFAMLTGLLALLIFKAASNPTRVSQARNRALAGVLEVRLYRHDPWVSLVAVGRVMRANLRYTAMLLVPMLASLMPVTLLLAQANAWFAVRPLFPGETVMVVARLKPDADVGVLDRVTLASSALRVLDPPVRAAGLREVAWRVTAGDTAGEATLVFSVDDAHLTKSVVCGYGLTRVSARRVADFWEGFIYPAEQRLPPSQPFDRLEVRYPKAVYTFFGWRTGWLQAMLAISFLTGLFLIKPLRVEI
jgi:hypothetical protein